MRRPDPARPRGVAARTIFATIVALALVLQLPGRAFAVAFTVDSTGDAGDASPGDGICDDGSGACTLRAAAEEAYQVIPDCRALGVIDVTIDIAVTGTITLASPLVMGNRCANTNNLTVVGPGASQLTISGGGFQVGAALLFSGASFTGLTISGAPIGIEVVITEASGLHLTDVHLVSNTTAILLDGASSFSIDHSEISGNAQGIFGAAGAQTCIQCMSGQLSHTAIVDNGFGISLQARNLTLEDCDVSRNRDGGIGVSKHFLSLTGPFLTLERCTIDGNGGGVFSSEGVTVLHDSVVSNNRSGGVVISGHGEIVNSTISGNTGGTFARAGIAYDFVNVPVPPQQSGLQLRNVTVTDNVVSTSDGSSPAAGLSAPGGHAVVSNSIVARNRTNGSAADCGGLVESGGYNLVGDPSGCTFSGATTLDLTGVDPHLGPLADNGGPTFTRALLPTSPAIDAGDPNGCIGPAGAAIVTDQRGVTRPIGTRCDIGAFEAGGAFVRSLRARAETNAAGHNGYVKVKASFVTSPPGDRFSSSSGVTLRVADGLDLDVACAWSAAECRALPGGRTQCRGADRKRRIVVAPSRSGSNAYVATASCKGFGFTGPFKAPLTVTIGQGDAWREGAIGACAGTGSQLVRCSQ